MGAPESACKPFWPTLALVHGDLNVESLQLKGWVYENDRTLWEIRRFWQHILEWKDLSIGPQSLTTFAEWLLMGRMLFGMHCVLPSVAAASYWASKDESPWPESDTSQSSMDTPTTVLLLAYFGVRRETRPAQMAKATQNC